MDGRRTIELGGKGKLEEKGGDLFLHRGTAHADEAGVVGRGAFEETSVETDLAYAGTRIGKQTRAEIGQQVVRTRRTCIPWMDTVGG